MRRNFAVLNSRIFICAHTSLLIHFSTEARDEVFEIIIERKIPPPPPHKELPPFWSFRHQISRDIVRIFSRRIRAYNWKGIPSRFSFAFALKNWTQHAGSVNEKSWSLRIAFYSGSFPLYSAYVRRNARNMFRVQYVPRREIFCPDRTAFIWV